MSDYPRCVFCGFDDHPQVLNEWECPDSMGFDAASIVATEAAQNAATDRVLRREEPRT